MDTVCPFGNLLSCFIPFVTSQGNASIPSFYPHDSTYRTRHKRDGLLGIIRCLGLWYRHLVNITMASYKIPVRLPNNQGYTNATVSPEDFAELSKPEMRWRMGSSGYPMYVKRINKELTTIWMHKLVAGGPATHINGDRLDCRRENLVESARKSPFEIKTPDALYDQVEEFEGGGRDLRFYSGFANVQYEKGKFYSGQVVYGVPHGFGNLYEADQRKHTSGNWVNGNMVKGMVVEYEYMPNCMCTLIAGCSTRRVRHIQLINKHEGLR